MAERTHSQFLLALGSQLAIREILAAHSCIGDEKGAHPQRVYFLEVLFFSLSNGQVVRTSPTTTNHPCSTYPHHPSISTASSITYA